MTRKNLRNLIKATSHIINRKKMYKAGKQWMVASLSALTILGLGASTLSPMAVNVNASSRPRTHRVSKTSKKAHALHKKIKNTTKTLTKHSLQLTEGKHRKKSFDDYESHSVCVQDQPLLRAYESNNNNETPYQHDEKGGQKVTPQKQVVFENDSGHELTSYLVNFPSDFDAGNFNEFARYVHTPKGYVTDANQSDYYVTRDYLDAQNQPVSGKVVLFSNRPNSSDVGITNTGYNEYEINMADYNYNSPYVKDVIKVHKVGSSNDNAPSKANANVNYVDNGNIEGNHSFPGEKGNSFKIGREPTGLPDGYHVVNPSQSIPYDGKTHKVPIAKNKHNNGAKARIHYVNKGHIKGRHNFPGKKHGHFRLGKHPEGLPRGYRVANPNRKVSYNNKVARVPIVKSVKSYKPGKHFRWFKMSNHGAWAHTTLDSVGHNVNHSVYLEPNRGLYYRIVRIYKIRKGNERRVRYAFKFVDHAKHGKIYYITGNPNYTVNSYWQKNELRHRRHTIRVIRGCAEYTSRYYDRYTKVRNFPVGTYLHVKKVIMIGRKGDCQTRFVLDNGRYVTANKNFTWLLN